MIYAKSFGTPEKRAELDQEINRLTELIKDFNVRKNYKNFFREKFFQEFRFSGKKIDSLEKKESLLNKSVININKITERVLIGSIIIHPTMLLKVIDKFKDISFL